MMLPKLRSRLPFGLALLALAPVAHAGPPFITDDPEPVELHHWEVILATQQFHDADGWSGTAPHFDINYGAFPEVQLHIQPAVAYNRNPGEPAHFGIGDLELGVKYRFLKETDTHPQIALYPLVELTTGNHDEGLGNGKTQVFIPVWMQKSFGDWTAFGGAGYWFNPGPGNRDYWFFGTVLQRKITKTFAAGLEVQFHTPNSEGAETSTVLNGGGMWDLSDTYHLIFSAGHSVQGQSQFQGYLGLQITWGPKDDKDAKDAKSGK